MHISEFAVEAFYANAEKMVEDEFHLEMFLREEAALRDLQKSHWLVIDDYERLHVYDILFGARWMVEGGKTLAIYAIPQRDALRPDAWIKEQLEQTLLPEGWHWLGDASGGQVQAGVLLQALIFEK